jgi:hypothetical protein
MKSLLQFWDDNSLGIELSTAMTPRPLPPMIAGIQHVPYNFPALLKQPGVSYSADLSYDAAYEAPPPPSTPSIKPAPVIQEKIIAYSPMFMSGSGQWEYVRQGVLHPFGVHGLADLGDDTTTTPPPTPSQTAQSEQEAAASYVRQLNLLRMGSFYDFGAGSNRRNAFFYGDRGLGNFSVGEDHMDIDDAQEGLGLDIFAAIESAVKSKDVQQQFSTLKSPLPSVSLPSSGIALPSWLTQFGAPVETLIKTTISKAKAQPTAAATTPTGEPKAKPAASGGLSLPMIGAGAALLILGYYAMRRR